MCQQWVGSLGLLLDIAGFLVLAREWNWAISLQGAEHVERRVGMEDESTEDRKYRWEGWLQQYYMRRGYFRTGLILIVLGFLGQFVGSLPPSYVVKIGLKSCS